jgi:hypothetical protein
MLTPMQLNKGGKLPARLAEIWAQLDEAQRRSLLDFAEFLLARNGAAGDAADLGSDTPLEPAHHPRPETESVVAAVKRLSRTYHMLDRQRLFSKTSELMSAHILQGREADVVIDELEEVFQEFYRDYLDSFGQK